MPICPKCYKMSDNSKTFCGHCGARLPQETPEAEPAPLQTATHQNTTGEQKEADNRSFITPSVAGIAIICFFLPWVKLSCVQKTASGADIGGIFWVVLIAAIAIVAFFFIFRANKKLELAKPAVIISAAIALIIMLWKYIEVQSGVKTEFGRVTAKDIGLEIQFGAVMTVLGFIASIVGTAFMKAASTASAIISTSPSSQAFCGECGARVAPGDGFCPECGTKM